MDQLGENVFFTMFFSSFSKIIISREQKYTIAYCTQYGGEENTWFSSLPVLLRTVITSWTVPRDTFSLPCQLTSTEVMGSFIWLSCQREENIFMQCLCFSCFLLSIPLQVVNDNDNLIISLWLYFSVGRKARRSCSSSVFSFSPKFLDLFDRS